MSRWGRRFFACDAALPPAASPPMTTTRLLTGSTLGQSGPRCRSGSGTAISSQGARDPAHHGSRPADDRALAPTGHALLRPAPVVPAARRHEQPLRAVRLPAAFGEVFAD